MDAARRAGRKLTINYWNNFEAPALVFKEFVANGKLGEPVHIESYYGYDLSDGFGQAVLSDTRHWVHGLPSRATSKRNRPCDQQGRPLPAGGL